MSDNKRKRSLSQALNSNVRKYGKAIITNLAIAMKTTQLYSFAHQNVKEALKELGEYLDSFVRLEGGADLARVEEYLFMNEIRARVELGGFQTYQFVLDVFKARGIGTISFKPGVTEQEISQLIDLLSQPPSGADDPWPAFRERLKQSTFENIEISKYEPNVEEHEEITEDKRAQAINTYFRAIHCLEDALEALKNDRHMNLKRLKRLLHTMVDILIDDEPTLLAMVNIKDYRSRLANHSVNVAVLSMAVGTKLGLGKKLLGDLGIAALMHDIGKVSLPLDYFTRDREKLTEDERATLDEHVYTGVELLLKQRIVDAVVKSMNVSFLHHFRFDGTGYPRTHVVNAQNFYSRIVAVADFYDNQTTPKDGAEPASPDEIFQALLDRSGTEFDALVVKAFTNLMGLYPVGCVVCLDSGEIGTVVSPATNPRYLDRPTVRVFTDEAGSSVDRVVNLMDKDASGNFALSILKLYQQQEVEIEMEEYLSVI